MEYFNFSPTIPLPLIIKISGFLKLPDKLKLATTCKNIRKYFAGEIYYRRLRNCIADGQFRTSKAIDGNDLETYRILVLSNINQNLYRDLSIALLNKKDDFITYLMPKILHPNKEFFNEFLLSTDLFPVNEYFTFTYKYLKQFGYFQKPFDMFKLYKRKKCSLLYIYYIIFEFYPEQRDLFVRSLFQHKFKRSSESYNLHPEVLEKLIQWSEIGNYRELIDKWSKNKKLEKWYTGGDKVKNMLKNLGTYTPGEKNTHRISPELEELQNRKKLYRDIVKTFDIDKNVGEVIINDSFGYLFIGKIIELCPSIYEKSDRFLWLCEKNYIRLNQMDFLVARFHTNINRSNDLLAINKLINVNEGDIICNVDTYEYLLHILKEYNPECLIKHRNALFTNVRHKFLPIYYKIIAEASISDIKELGLVLLGLVLLGLVLTLTFELLLPSINKITPIKNETTPQINNAHPVVVLLENGVAVCAS